MPLIRSYIRWIAIKKSLCRIPASDYFERVTSGSAGDVVPVIVTEKTLNNIPQKIETIPWVITAENSELWLAFGRLGKESGLEWGGTWEPLNQFGIGWDAPHYQYLGNS